MTAPGILHFVTETDLVDISQRKMLHAICCMAVKHVYIYRVNLHTSCTWESGSTFSHLCYLMM